MNPIKGEWVKISGSEIPYRVFFVSGELVMLTNTGNENLRTVRLDDLEKAASQSYQWQEKRD